jgi:hypothetical protein
MDWEPFDSGIFFRDMKRSEPHCGFDAGEVSTSFVVPNFIDWFPGGGATCVGRARCSSLLNFPICLIRSLEEIFEEVLEKIDTGGELNIDVAVIFENEPRNVRNNEFIFLLATPVFEIP